MTSFSAAFDAVSGSLTNFVGCKNIVNKNAFQWDAYRLLVDRMCGGVSAWGVSSWGCLPGGGLPRGDVCHVTYPIMHLMLPVCCLHTN